MILILDDQEFILLFFAQKLSILLSLIIGVLGKGDMGKGGGGLGSLS